jgi:hypothetical protein
MSIGTRSPRGIFGQILIMALNRPVFVADYYAVDGITGKVSAWIDYNDVTHQLAQTLNARQVAVPAAHADFGGKLCATFDGATAARWYQSNRTAVSWNYLVNGPSRAYSTLTVTAAGAAQLIWETDNTGSGGATNELSATNVVRWALFRSGGSAFLGVSTAFTTNVAGSVVVAVSAYDPRRYMKKNGIAAETGALLNNNINTSSSLSFGARSSNDSLPLKARVRHLLIVTPDLGAQEDAAVYSYIQQDTGIAP